MQNMGINFDMSMADDMSCSKCENVYFKSLVRVKRVSALVSPDGQETYVPIQVLACENCGNIVQDIEESGN